MRPLSGNTHGFLQRGRDALIVEHPPDGALGVHTEHVERHVEDVAQSDDVGGRETPEAGALGGDGGAGDAERLADVRVGVAVDAAEEIEDVADSAGVDIEEAGCFPLLIGHRHGVDYVALCFGLQTFAELHSKNYTVDICYSLVQDAPP